MTFSHGPVHLDTIAWLAGYAFLLLYWLCITKSSQRRDRAAHRLGEQAQRLGRRHRKARGRWLGVGEGSTPDPTEGAPDPDKRRVLGDRSPLTDGG